MAAAHALDYHNLFHFLFLLYGFFRAQHGRFQDDRLNPGGGRLRCASGLQPFRLQRFPVKARLKKAQPQSVGDDGNRA